MTCRIRPHPVCIVGRLSLTDVIHVSPSRTHDWPGDNREQRDNRCAFNQDLIDMHWTTLITSHCNDGCDYRAL